MMCRELPPASRCNPASTCRARRSSLAQYQRQPTQRWENSGSRRLLGTRGWGSTRGGLPIAIPACLANRQIECLACSFQVWTVRVRHLISQRGRYHLWVDVGVWHQTLYWAVSHAEKRRPDSNKFLVSFLWRSIDRSASLRHSMLIHTREVQHLYRGRSMWVVGSANRRCMDLSFRGKR